MQSTEPDTTTLSHTEKQDTAKKGKKKERKQRIGRRGKVRQLTIIKKELMKKQNNPAGWGKYNKGAEREEMKLKKTNKSRKPLT